MEAKMKTFIAMTKGGDEIRYTDRKRPLYTLSLLLPAVPTLAAGLYFTPVGVWATLLPFTFLFILIPIIDAFVGGDPHNPPEEVADSMAADPYYSWLVRITVPVSWIGFLMTVFLIGTQALPWWSLVALAVGVGSISGGALTIGHELGHKSNKTDKLFAMWSNAVVGYAHFRIEHNQGHHVKVSTPDDPASARMGESVYRFVLREIPGTLKNGWSLEAKRLAKRGKPTFCAENEILQGWLITLSAAAILIFLLGLKIVPFILVHHAFGWYALTQANYIEHYGLLRQKRANGHYEPCRPHHSWNTNHRISNLMTFHLQRHSDHHSHPARPYQTLRDLPDVPSLPSGYPGMLVLAAVPPLWFRVMDPKVMNWANGDLSKVNVLSAKRAQLERRWSKKAGSRVSV